LADAQLLGCVRHGGPKPRIQLEEPRLFSGNLLWCLNTKSALKECKMYLLQNAP
jgi:hypothetical protein